MPYIIGFGMRNSASKVRTAEKPTAREALLLVDALQRSDEEIKFIRSPAEGEFDVALLRMLAAREEEAQNDIA